MSNKELEKPQDPIKLKEDMVPRNTDVLIVGGGLVGWSVAFWIRHFSRFSVTLIERDPSYSRSSSALGSGFIHQHFSLPENIQMSLFGAQFIRQLRHYLVVNDDEPPSINFTPQGQLTLASAELSNKLKDDYKIQSALGAKVELLSASDVAHRWPWLNLDGIETALYGYENEGWFDTWLLLKALRNKAHDLGVNYIIGELIDLEPTENLMKMQFPDRPKRPSLISRIARTAIVNSYTSGVSKITFAEIVNAAGSWSKEICALLEIGKETIPFSMPIQKRRRVIFIVTPSFHCSTVDYSRLFPGLDTPMIYDPSDIRIRRHGLTGDFVVEVDHSYYDESVDTSLSFEEVARKRSIENMIELSKPIAAPELEIDPHLYETLAAPLVEKRIPALKNATVRCAWSTYIDYNRIDQSPIIGPHPFHGNMYLCSGFSGNSAQHSIAAGRAIAETVCNAHYRTIDLTRFSFDRFYTNELMFDGLKSSPAPSENIASNVSLEHQVC